MKVHRYSEHQRRMWVHEMTHKTKTIKAICTEASISRATLYNWLNEFETAKEEAKQDVSPAWQPNDKYKMLLSALLKTDKDKLFSRRLAGELVKRYNLTVAQACELVNMPADLYGYRPRKPEADDKDVYAALVHLLEEKKSRSLEDCIAILQPSHPDWTVKQIKRIYRQGRLYLKRTRIRRMPSLPQEMAEAAQEVLSRLRREDAFWYLGLAEQQTSEEINWLLFILDYNDGTPLNAIAGSGGISEVHVMQLIAKAATENGFPKKIRIPAVAPFASRDLSKWSWENKVAIYNLSMAKPENLLEAQYIQDDIKKQLTIDETTTSHQLQTTADSWIKSFINNSTAATNYFIKETVAEQL